MGRIADYINDSSPSLEDKVIGTNADNLDETVNFRIADIVALLNTNTVLSGIVDPTTEGQDGDFYINTETWDIFGPRVLGVWGSGTTLIGPTGEAGIGGSSTRLISGGAAWSGTGMIFNVSELVYLFDNIQGTSDATSVTLSDGDATFDRIDAIVVRSNGQVSVLEGTPSADPVSPTITQDQLLVAYVNVLALSTTPDLTMIDIWLDDLVSDATVTVDGGVATVSPSSTVDPYGGSSFCIAYRGTSAQIENEVSLQTLLPVFVATNDSLTFYIRLDEAIPNINEVSLFVRLYLTGQTPINNAFVELTGFNQNLVGSWQLVVLPIDLWGAGISQIQRIGIQSQANGGTIPYSYLSWSLDKVQIQNGVTPSPTGVRYEDILGNAYDSVSLVQYIVDTPKQYDGAQGIVGVTLASAGGITPIDLSESNGWRMILTEDTLLQNPSNDRFTTGLIIGEQDAGVPRTMTFDTAWSVVGDPMPMTVGAGFSIFIYSDGAGRLVASILDETL